MGSQAQSNGRPIPDFPLSPSDLKKARVGAAEPLIELVASTMKANACLAYWLIDVPDTYEWPVVDILLKSLDTAGFVAAVEPASKGNGRVWRLTIKIKDGAASHQDVPEFPLTVEDIYDAIYTESISLLGRIAETMRDTASLQAWNIALLRSEVQYSVVALAARAIEARGFRVSIAHDRTPTGEDCWIMYIYSQQN